MASATRGISVAPQLSSFDSRWSLRMPILVGSPLAVRNAASSEQGPAICSRDSRVRRAGIKACFTVHHHHSNVTVANCYAGRKK